MTTKSQQQHHSVVIVLIKRTLTLSICCIQFPRSTSITIPASTGGAKRKNTVHTEWYHSKCGLWSSETIETGSGVLRYIRNAIKRAKARNGTSTCSLCNGIGATIGCCSSHCKRSYHVHCAKKANLWSSTNNVADETYCFEHVSLCPHPIRMPNLNDNRMLLSAPADRIIMDVVDNSNNPKAPK